MRGRRCVDSSEFEDGLVTVTRPRVYVTDGFTNDGVVDVLESRLSSLESWRLPISSTTDEGIGGEQMHDVYVDDVIWIDGGEGYEGGWHENDALVS